ncbi:TORTIFOLIA1-like protein 3 isoform X2 [Corylus avellana]|uniref:TORTIFOLIA1-like protein 3 isoform X2 n=1 Tax=Corylus avellana TaxID=13451 RepID=UPI00286B9ED9|nr:TORTIFOLIA1-like protein 3 isoform X2 [Corylus avellana]
MAQNLKHRVFTCLTKLSDRDTHSIAASELESIARTLDPTQFPTFLSCIQSTDPSDKSPVRKQCVSLLAVLSETHGNTLYPYLSKMLSSVTRRLRDPDSSVRSACVNSVAALSSHVTKPPFVSFLKPLADALFTEQDPNAQIGAALCLASAIDSAPDPDPARLARLLPRFEKLLKCESFKAKAALLALICRVVSVGAASFNGALKNLVPCLVEFLSNDDWTARKAAAEALLSLAVVERDSLQEYKPGCVKVFESRRYDKVKAVREVMNQMLEAWKQIPDVSDEASPPPHSEASSKENASDGRHPPTGSKNSCIAGSKAPQLRKNPILTSRLTPTDQSSATGARKRSPLQSNNKKIEHPIFRKLDCKRSSDWKVEIAVPNVSGPSEADYRERDENVPESRNTEKNRLSKPETKRSLFSKNSDDKMHKFGGYKNGSRVVPCHEETPESPVVVSNVIDFRGNRKESEDLSLIRNQLFQIEKQQSSLLDLLQAASQLSNFLLASEIHWELTKWNARLGDTCAWPRVGTR